MTSGDDAAPESPLRADCRLDALASRSFVRQNDLRAERHLEDCPLCGAVKSMAIVTESVTVDHHGMSVTFTDTMDKCSACREGLYDPEQSKAHTRAFARALFLQHGVKFGTPRVQARLEAEGIFRDEQAMNNGSQVRAFEEAFAAYVGAKYAIGCANGTVSLSAALVALGVKPGDRVATTPLTMAATSIAILNVGAVPDFVDVQHDTWLVDELTLEIREGTACCALPVSLYGLHQPYDHRLAIDDAAQTLRQHSGCAFTSYSLQSSKILQTGEGGVLVTNDESLAEAARSYLSLGYAMRADQARIDSAAIKASDYIRHVRYPAINGRMNDVTAAAGLAQLARADDLLAQRRLAASFYAHAVERCAWLTPQYVPDGWIHDRWTFAVACDTPERARALQDAVVAEGGERPYGAWRLTFDEPAFAHLDPGPDACPVARDLQPRLLQFATNDRISADRNARALSRAIAKLS